MIDAAVAERTVAECFVCSSPVYAEGLETCHLHVQDALGITYRQLGYWTRRGYLRPGQGAGRRGASGSGIARQWPRTEIEIAIRMGRLAAAGIAPDRTAVFARESWPKGEIAPGLALEATS